MIEHFYAGFFSELTPKHETEKETSQMIAEMLDINAFRVAMNLRKEFQKEDLDRKIFKQNEYEEEDQKTEELFWEIHNSEDSSWALHSTIFKEEGEIEGKLYTKKVEGKPNDLFKIVVTFKD